MLILNICFSFGYHGLGQINSNFMTINGTYPLLQRVLEHCHEAKTQHIMMDEIFQSVCMLAQDQYGNYVVQVCHLFWQLFILSM